MKIIYPFNYSGYIPVLRGMLLLVKTKTITLSQVGPYLCFVMQADFDSRHPHYRVVLRDDKQIAKEFDIDETTVYRYRKMLIKKGLLIREDGLTKIPNYYMFELDKVKKLTKISTSKLQEIFAKPKESFADIELFIAKTQSVQPQNNIQSSDVSYKGGVSSEEDIDLIREYFNENDIDKDIR